MPNQRADRRIREDSSALSLRPQETLDDCCFSLPDAARQLPVVAAAVAEQQRSLCACCFQPQSGAAAYTWRACSRPAVPHRQAACMPRAVNRAVAAAAAAEWRLGAAMAAAAEQCASSNSSSSFSDDLGCPWNPFLSPKSVQNRVFQCFGPKLFSRGAYWRHRRAVSQPIPP